MGSKVADLEALASSMGVEVNELSKGFELVAPQGKVFAANGCHCYVDAGADWTPTVAVVRQLKKVLAMGLEDCEDPDCDWCTERRRMGPRQNASLKDARVGKQTAAPMHEADTAKSRGLPEPTPEMEHFFDERTRRHVSLVDKWAKRIEAAFPQEFAGLSKRMPEHDASKWEEPERTPYVYLTWKHAHEDYEYPPGVGELVKQVAIGHVHANSHHPESKGPRNMDDLDLGEMMADWCAMSEELGNSPVDWAKKNVGTKWDFSTAQSELIFRVLRQVWEDKSESRCTAEAAQRLEPSWMDPLFFEVFSKGFLGQSLGDIIKAAPDPGLLDRTLEVLKSERWKASPWGAAAMEGAVRLVDMWNSKSRTEWPKYFDPYFLDSEGRLIPECLVSFKLVLKPVLDELYGPPVELERVELEQAQLNMCYDNAMALREEKGYPVVAGFLVHKSGPDAAVPYELEVHAFNQSSEGYVDSTPVDIAKNWLCYHVLEYQGNDALELGYEIWSKANAITKAVYEYLVEKVAAAPLAEAAAGQPRGTSEPAPGRPEVGAPASLIVDGRQERPFTVTWVSDDGKKCRVRADVPLSAAGSDEVLAFQEAAGSESFMLALGQDGKWRRKAERGGRGEVFRIGVAGPRTRN